MQTFISVRDSLHKYRNFILAVGVIALIELLALILIAEYLIYEIMLERFLMIV